MKILIFALLVTVVSAGRLKVDDIKCTLGPSYWCRNQEQAKECQAVPYCVEHVWKAPSNFSCVGCQFAVIALKYELSKPEVKKAIIAKVEEGCKRFQDLEPECKALIEKYASMAFDSLLKLLSEPQKACAKLGYCPASKEKVTATLLSKALPIKLKAFSGIIMKEHYKRKNLPRAITIKTSADCIMCEFVADQLDKMLTKNATEKEIKTALDKVCTLLPSAVETECKQFVNKYFDEIIQLLSQELSPKQLCTSLGLCKENNINQLQVEKTKGNGEVCDICTTVLTYLKNLLQDNSTEVRSTFKKEFLDGLKQMCSNLPQQLASECTSLVNEYGKQVLEMIATSDPKTLCKDIGLCASKMKLHHIVDIKDKCYLGGSYWCASFHNAVKCNALSYCKKHAW